MKHFLKYFLRGFLILAPITITVFIIVWLLKWLNDFFDIGIPGLGILLILILITALGYIGSSIVARPLLGLMERYICKLPLISIIYSSIKDLFDAFVGENQKFNQPVLVRLYAEAEVFKMGFVTQHSMEAVELPGHVAVYFPNAYDLSGELHLVPRQNVRAVQVPSAMAMKFVVSGGVSNI